MCLGVFRLGFILFGTLCFLDLGDYFLPHFREVFNYYFLKYFLMVFLFVFFFWDSYNSDVEAFNIVPEVSEVVLIFFKFFFPLFHLYLPFYLLPHLSYLLPPLFCFGSLQSVFDLIYCIIHYILTLFKISSRFLLNLSCIFSVLVSRLFFCDSILFSRFWIIFTIIIWNSLSGRFPISSSLVWFGGHFFGLVWWAFILFLYLLGIPLSLHLLYIAVFGVAFLYSGSLWFLFIVEVPHCGWVWMGGLSRFPS